MRYEDLESLMSENGIEIIPPCYYIGDGYFLSSEGDGMLILWQVNIKEPICEYEVEDLEEWCPTFKAWNECPTCNGHGRYYSVWSNDPEEEGMETECDCCEKPINK